MSPERFQKQQQPGAGCSNRFGGAAGSSTGDATTGGRAARATGWRDGAAAARPAKGAAAWLRAACCVLRAACCVLRAAAQQSLFLTAPGFEPATSRFFARDQPTYATEPFETVCSPAPNTICLHFVCVPVLAGPTRRGSTRLDGEGSSWLCGSLRPLGGCSYWLNTLPSTPLAQRAAVAFACSSASARE